MKRFSPGRYQNPGNTKPISIIINMMGVKYGPKNFSDCAHQFRRLAIDTRKMIDDLLMPSSFLLGKMTKEQKMEIQKYIKLIDKNIKHFYDIFN